MRTEGRREGPGARGKGGEDGGPAGRLSSCPQLSPQSRVQPVPVGQRPRAVPARRFGCWASQQSPLCSPLPPSGERGFVAITSISVCKPNFNSPDAGGPVIPHCPALAEGDGVPPTGQPGDTSLPSSPPRQLQHDFPRALIFSTDDYFFREDGAYEFNPDFLEEAHEWNQERGDTALSELAGCPIVYIHGSRMSKSYRRSLIKSSAISTPQTDVRA